MNHEQTTPLDRGFNIAVLHIASRLFPCGFDVIDDAPTSLAELQAYVARTGRVAVWSGASNTTMFADAEVNYSFRAWHDWGHLKGNHPFTPEGERATAAMQCEHIRTLYGHDARADRFCRLIDCEVNGQVAYEQAHGHFPVDQMAFTRAYLEHGEH